MEDLAKKQPDGLDQTPRNLESEWSETQQIFVRDPPAVKAKLLQMLKDKQASLVADFDFSLTRQHIGSTPCDGSFTIFRNPKYISKEFMEKADALHAKYRPIQVDTSRPVSERAAIMTQWWEEHFQLFLKQKVSLHDFDAMIFSSNFYFRHGISNLMNEVVPKYKIPLFVVSAGLGTLIEESFKQLMKKEQYDEMRESKQLRIYTNMLEADSNGILTKLTSAITHSYNKELLLEKEASLPELKGNVILLGDLIQDIKIMHHVEASNILTLGCFNGRPDLMEPGEAREKKEQLLKDYVANYDIVFSGEANLDHLTFLLESICTGEVDSKAYSGLAGSQTILDLLTSS